MVERNPRYAIFLKRMNSVIEEKGIKKSWLARKLGMSPGWLSQVLSGEIDLTINHLMNMVDVLQISTTEIIPLLPQEAAIHGVTTFAEFIDLKVRERERELQKDPEASH